MLYNFWILFKLIKSFITLVSSKLLYVWRGGGLVDDFQPDGRVFDRLPLSPPRRDLGQVLYLQSSVRFGVKLRYCILAVVGSAYEQYWTWRGAIEMSRMNEWVSCVCDSPWNADTVSVLQAGVFLSSLGLEGDALEMAGLNECIISLKNLFVLHFKN